MVIWNRIKWTFKRLKDFYIIAHPKVKWENLLFSVALNGKESTCQRRRQQTWVWSLGRSPVGGNGNPLQYSCLENPMDREAWQATVHRVAKSWIWLKRLSTKLNGYSMVFLIRHSGKGSHRESKTWEGARHWEYCMREYFRGDENILYLNCSGGSMTVCLSKLCNKEWIFMYVNKQILVSGEGDELEEFHSILWVGLPGDVI